MYKNRMSTCPSLWWVPFAQCSETRSQWGAPRNHLSSPIGRGENHNVCASMQQPDKYCRTSWQSAKLVKSPRTGFTHRAKLHKFHKSNGLFKKRTKEIFECFNLLQGKAVPGFILFVLSSCSCKSFRLFLDLFFTTKPVKRLNSFAGKKIVQHVCSRNWSWKQQYYNAVPTPVGPAVPHRERSHLVHGPGRCSNLHRLPTLLPAPHLTAQKGLSKQIFFKCLVKKFFVSHRKWIRSAS